ncbi:hypothetical protein [Roseivirga sp.]|uniref:hypothetical protein n=1 Tax=Roseivirga sp. TaxID=1964215 RepID=UPI003B8B0156
MKYKLIILSLLCFLCCSPKVDIESVNEIANLEFQIETFIKLDGVSVNSKSFLDKIHGRETLIFSFNERQCIDCITKHLSMLGELMKDKIISVKSLVIVADFENIRMLNSFLSRFNLLDVTTILSQEVLIDPKGDWFDQPTLFIFNQESNSAHFVYQPTLYTQRFSKTYFQLISQKMNRKE